ncbi:hypothetical protein K402DRAFT_228161 [Aulographum hederae CBS 113979]|uniref:Uncharacterized protein n=1 Tax=Aulographum hederae CBS 113979 TaxID=1176131 RepID=A0A6G1HBJ7_9PEZI|nr:hypothetical protein K402DRAFT_228161 [Aulographum hederae CBS 113979]
MQRIGLCQLPRVWYALCRLDELLAPYWRCLDIGWTSFWYHAGGAVCGSCASCFPVCVRVGRDMGKGERRGLWEAGSIAESIRRTERKS